MRVTPFLLAFLGFAFQLCGAGYTPPADSPLARSEHPRIFITQNDIPRLQAKIQTYYGADFQRFIGRMDEVYNTAPGSGDLGQWNEIFAAARSFALLYVLDPASIGFSSQHDRNQYGRKAIAIALHIAANLPDSWKEKHHGAKNLTTSEGGLASLALQVVYDWTHDLASLSDRQAMANRLITMWDNRYDSRKVKLENHYAANSHVYAGALCFYGDSDLGAGISQKASLMMDSFQDVFLTRQLGVAEKLFEGSSDWMEGDSYSLDAFVGLMMLAAASGSALDENFFATNSWLHYAPFYIYYTTMPMPYKGEYYFSQQNTSSVSTINGRSASSVMNMAAAMLVDDDPDLASFAGWFVEKSPYGTDVNDFKYYDPMIYDFFYKFIFGTRQVSKKSPTGAGIPLSYHLGQMQAMRSDHGFTDATLIQFFSLKFWYSNGHNEEEQGAFNIHRFGPLAISSANSKNSGDGVPRVSSNGKGYALNNVIGIGDDPELDTHSGSAGKAADTPDHFNDEDPAHIGTVDAREYRPGLYDYINYDYTRSYKGGDKTNLARRALVYLRGPVNHEFVVVMDRLDTQRQKYFLIHTPADIAAVDGSWSSAGSGHWTSNGSLFKVVNRIDQAHGQMYVKTLFPKNRQVHKFGGPGKEWVWADGSKLNYSGTFGEIARYLLSDHTFQIRSHDNLFLTVMQIGDANSMGAAAPMVGLSGSNWFGALMDNNRLVIFSKTETPLTSLSYTVESSKTVKHLVTEMQKNRDYTVRKNGAAVAKGSTGKNGTISFTDSPGGSATYRVELGGVTDIGDAGDVILPEEIELVNYPNPFNPSTTIRFSVPVNGLADLRIFSTTGRLIRSLLSRFVEAGVHRILWDGTSNSGRRVASGVYFYRLTVNNLVKWNKLILAK